MFVLCGVDTTSRQEPVVVKYGPTSENAGLLATFDMHWPIAVDRVVVVRTMGDGLLHVSKKDLIEALR